MAQYYQVTSLEELHKLYPNLQLENLEGIPCMIQDDQVTQFSDKQGQQVIATVEQTGVQLAHNPGPSQQCTSQQSQFVVQQPTQYVIHQKDPVESQPATVQYIQQRQQPAQNNEEIPVPEFKDPTVRCISTDIGNEEQHSLQPQLIKQESPHQCLTQVQPIMQQPIKMHPQIQALDMGGNILVLQKQEKQELLLNQAKGPELISNSHELQQQQQQQQQPQHILIQMHQQPKSQQIITQKRIIQKNENSEECVQQQVLQNRHTPQIAGQQQQIIHQPQQQIIQPLQYFNQVTVIDNFTQPKVTIEHHAFSNENVAQQQQVQAQIQQFRPKKTLQQTGLPTIIQQPQVLVPQRFGMSSPPPLGNSLPQNKRKVLQQDVEVPPAPVFIVQKVESPFVIRQHQAKFRFQSQQPGNEKINEDAYQSISTQSDQQMVECVPQENQQMVPVSMSLQQTEVHQNINVAGQVIHSQPNKCSADGNVTYGQVKIGIIEQPVETRAVEQMTKLKVCTPLSVRTSVAKIKTVEQQTDPAMVSDGKEAEVQQFLRFVDNADTQSRNLSMHPSEMQSPAEIQNSVQMNSRGRGMRGHSPRGYPCFPRGRGVQVQTQSPRMPSLERGGFNRKVRSPRGRGKIGRGAWSSGGPDQCQVPLVRMGLQQVTPSPPTKIEASQTSNEVVEETKMVVLLINGEKKIVKIPCSQNILLGQLLQQAGLSLTSPTPISIEQVVDNTSDHMVSKNNPTNHQQLSLGIKPSTVTQVVSVPGTPGAPRSIVATIQQRPRVQAPFPSPQASNVSIIRQRLHFGSPRVTAAGFSGQPAATTNDMSETTGSQPQNAQTSTPPTGLVKEEPRFVTGFMAICPFCGISSLDFNKCIRCRRKLPENVKSQSIFSAKKKKEKANGSNEKVDDSNSDAEEKQSDLSSPDGKDKSDKKKLKPCLKKKKISDEPAEILILSSDEEEESKTKKPCSNTTTLPVLKKEPVYTETLTESEITNMLEKNNLSEDLMKNVQPGSFTTLQCRTIRIGSYKVQPKERIFLSSRGIRLLVNSLKNETSTIIIPTSDILKVLIHFGKQIPVIFIYPLPKIGNYIRDTLGMDNKMGPYYDPTSTQEETHKRITLLLEKITEDNKIAINKIFGHDKLEELSEKEANAILIRASPIDTQNTAVCKSTDSVRKIMVYPPPPEKGGITLNNQDYACLGEDQFLNDVIIDFYLKYLMLKVLSPVDRNRTHVFSTFFYKRLTTKPKSLRKNDPENDPKLSPAEKRHMRVKGWTKQVNLFEKDFIIVPINEHSHWFLAIICFPGLTGPVRFSDNTPVEPEEVTPKKNCRIVQIGNTTITHIIKADGNTISLEMDSGSDRDEAEGDQDDLHPSSDDEGSEQVEEETSTPPPVQIPLLAPTTQAPPAVKDTKIKPAKRKSYKEPIKQPCILIFDSLAGASRVRVVATLRDYLKIEYKKKMGQERDFSKDTIKGAVPKVPQQNNFTDCGLYVLQYVESFFQDPLHDFKLPLKYLQDWFPEEVVSSKRQKLASLIRSLMEEQGIKVEEMGLPVLTFTNGNNVGDEQSRMEEDEVEDEEEYNEDEEEILRNSVQIAEFENEDDEDLNVEEEDEMEDDEDEEENEEEDDDDDFEDEELEVGEIPRRWRVTASGSCCELEPLVKHSGPVMFKTSGLVEYDPSDSDEDNQNLCADSIVISGNQASDPVETPEKEYCDVDQSVVSENRKTVPLSEFLDFESQISCTTIERNLEGRNSESDVISEREVDEEQCRGTADEEETSFETSTREDTNSTTESFNQSLEKKTYRPSEVLVKDNKIVEVSDIIKKLMNDKNITLKRKENELDSNIFRKHLDAKKIKVKDCDETEKATNPSSPPKTNSGVYKRPYQTLKSVRIPKKTERNVELCSKRQKVDER